jgi:hypothetical protein
VIIGGLSQPVRKRFDSVMMMMMMMMMMMKDER